MSSNDPLRDSQFFTLGALCVLIMAVMNIHSNSSEPDPIPASLDTSKHRLHLEPTNLIASDKNEVPSEYLANQSSNQNPSSSLEPIPEKPIQFECGPNKIKAEVISESTAWRLKLETLKNELLSSSDIKCKGSPAGIDLAQVSLTNIIPEDNCAPLATYEKIRDNLKNAYFSYLVSINKQESCREFARRDQPQRVANRSVASVLPEPEASQGSLGAH
jgi:hypothetical protein